MIYFDHAASAPVSKEVGNHIKDLLCGVGNPSAQHAAGAEQAKIIANSRKTIMNAIGATDGSLVFTSGGSESNNMAVNLAAKIAYASGRNRIIISATEHKSVINACSALKKRGFIVEFAPIAKNGSVNTKALASMIDWRTLLVSVMAVNNETGIINNVKSVSETVRKYGAIFHIDAVQALPHGLGFPVDCADMISFSGHKVGTPAGVGALYLNKRISTLVRMHKISFIYGGGQEFGIRAGTENVPYIAGFAKAVCLLHDDSNVASLRDYAEQEILKIFPNARVHGDKARRVPTISNISLGDVDAASVVTWLSMHDIMISSGSACNTGSNQPSHVLLAMGDTDVEAFSSIRLSFSDCNTIEEVDALLDCLREYAKKYVSCPQEEDVDGL